ncbi:MAG: Crossover junction endodeoxyribonuclease RuvC [Candidatus Anoxychlamydiales bacterium]|nr:Crossover junction endodeoxyribonuclease RuvC [Candidatus Anoxychlamydiales bacterium]
MDEINKQIILGIDPGTIITGYGVIEFENNKLVALDYGAIKPPKKEKLSKRYFIIFEAINHLIKKYNPTAISVETQFVKNNPQVALKLGMARGSVIIAAEKNNIPIFEYAPKKAKLAVVGNGGASKEQVQKMVKMLLNLSKVPTPEDAADALSLAICHIHQIDFLKKIGK